MITTLGRSLLMNRVVNDRMKAITYIALGKGTNTPSRQDLKLGKETIRKLVDYTVDIENNVLIFEASFTAKEILNTTEIGIFTDDEVLVSRDVYETVTDNILEDTTSSININYRIYFNTGATHSKWLTSTTSDDILYRFENNPVISVREINTDTGYLRVDSLEDLNDLAKAGYFYDVISRNLYIKTSDCDNISTIDSKEVVVLIN
jgi:hypothetical protein